MKLASCENKKKSLVKQYQEKGVATEMPGMYV